MILQNTDGQTHKWITIVPYKDMGGIFCPEIYTFLLTESAYFARSLCVIQDKKHHFTGWAILAFTLY